MLCVVLNMSVPGPGIQNAGVVHELVAVYASISPGLIVSRSVPSFETLDLNEVCAKE